MPESRAPPNGVSRSRTWKQFTHTVPATSAAPSRSERRAEPVKTVAASP